MALVNSAFTVNVTPGAMPPIVHVSEYDTGRTYTVTINGENGGAFVIPTGASATIEGTLNGEIGFSTTATIANNAVSFALTESMTAKSGKAWCKIKLTLNDEPIQTCAFILDVDRAGVEADTVIGAQGFEERIAEAVAEWMEQQGFTSPTVSITPITGGNRVTFTDAEHPDGQSIDVMDGEVNNIDTTLSVQGAAADAKATGDAIQNINNKLGLDANIPVVKTPEGGFMAGLSTTGAVVSSTRTKAFYLSCQPNTTYRMVTNQSASTDPGAGHFLAAFSSMPQVGSQATSFVYKTGIPAEPVELTTGANDAYILFGHGLWATDENITIYEISSGSGDSRTVSERLEALENAEVVVDTTLSISGEAADAKATGDAISDMKSEIYGEIGFTTAPKILPTGNFMGGLSTSGGVTSSTATKSFYFEGQPNTTYKLVTNSQAASLEGAGHFISVLPSVPAVGVTATNYIYRTDLPGDLEITTGSSGGYIYYGHGHWTTDEWLSVYDLTHGSTETANFGERIDALENEIGQTVSFSDSESRAAFVTLMNKKAQELGMDDSSFASASGLSAQNVASPRDLFKMGFAVCADHRALRIWGVPAKDYAISGANARTITVQNAGYDLIETDFAAYYTILGLKTGSLGIGAIRRAGLFLVEIEEKQVLISIMVNGQSSFDNIWKASKEVADMVKTQLQGGTPTEGSVLAAIDGGYVAGVVPNVPGGFCEMVDAAYVVSRNGVIKEDETRALTPASVSKTLTMLCALDEVADLKGTKVTVKSVDIESGSGSTYQNGDTLSLDDALCIMMAESSNTLAQAIGRTVGNIRLSNQYKIQH